MKRLLLVTGAAVGACAIAVPAAAGLSSNPSFSEHVPVRVPGSAKVVGFDDHGGAATTIAPRTVGPTSTTTAKPRPTEPGDDRGSRTGTHIEPGDDHGSRSTHVEPGDDHGSRSTHAEPGDDHHQRGKTTTASAATSSANHDHGSDDATSGHGGKHGKDH